MSCAMVFTFHCIAPRSALASVRPVLSPSIKRNRSVEEVLSQIAELLQHQ
jgi:hypothetical protein